MVNLADQDTSFLVPCRHCGDLLPEQDRICPHCGKDQTVAPVKGGEGGAAFASPAGPGMPSDDGAPDPFAAARGPSDFTAAGLGPRATDDGAGRRRKAIGIVALIAGVLLLGTAYDRYAKQRAVTPPPATLAQEAPTTPTRPAPAAGPGARTPAAAVPSATSATPPAETPSTTPPATSPAAAATADAPASPCNEALAAMSLCARP